MDFNGILIYGNSYLAQGTKRMTYDEIVTVSERSERGSLIRLYPHLSFSLIFTQDEIGSLILYSPHSLKIVGISGCDRHVATLLAMTGRRER